jgi:7-cyano-7-deazaguanine reductase
MPLGTKAPQIKGHDPSVLYPIRRKPCLLPIFGYDLWRSYEVSWLNPKGKPEIGIMEIIYPVQSECIVESKSLKLYLNGLSFVNFNSHEEVEKTIRKDLNGILSSPWVSVNILDGSHLFNISCETRLSGTSLDRIDVTINEYQRNDGLLTVENSGLREEMLSSDLLKTYCPITGQPDWASVAIAYRGSAINRASLLKYICSYRDHEGFAEEVCEQIFLDISRKCSPEILSVRCFYTRRGGIDITPHRCSYPIELDEIERIRLIRQ